MDQMENAVHEALRFQAHSGTTDGGGLAGARTGTGAVNACTGQPCSNETPRDVNDSGGSVATPSSAAAACPEPVVLVVTAPEPAPSANPGGAQRRTAAAPAAAPSKDARCGALQGRCGSLAGRWRWPLGEWDWAWRVLQVS